MTLEERMEFLHRSIESHDRQIGGLIENGAKMVEGLDVRIDALGLRIDALVASTQLNFERLTTAMLGLTDHAADHGRRLDRLEAQ
jgi:hypothetical protein